MQPKMHEIACKGVFRAEVSNYGKRSSKRRNNENYLKFIEDGTVLEECVGKDAVDSSGEGRKLRG